MRLNIALLVIFAIISLTTLTLMFAPPQLTLINQADPILGTPITKGDVIAFISIFSSAATLAMLIITLKQRR